MPSKKTETTKVLIIEDEPIFRDLAKRMLYGYDCTAVSSIEEARMAFIKKEPDVVLLDITLPDGSGLELLKEIKEIHSGARVVMLTRSNLEDDVRSAMQNGATGYIIKPLSRRKVKEVMGRFAVRKTA